MIEHELTIEKINGQKIVGKIFIPEKGLQKYPAVIFSHGFNENYRQLEHHAADYAHCRQRLHHAAQGYVVRT